MRKTFYLLSKGVLVTTLSAIILAGCHHVKNEVNIEPIEQGSESELSIEEAKDHFFSQVYRKGQNTKLNPPKEHKLYFDKLNLKTLVWDSAVSRKGQQGQQVLVPMDLGALRWTFREGKYLYDNNLLNYVLMYKDSASKIATEWVTLHPDREWINGNRKMFIGKVVIRNWEGEYLREMLYNRDGFYKTKNISEASRNAKISGPVTYGQFCYVYANSCDNLRISSTTSWCGEQSVCIPIVEWGETPWVPITPGTTSGQNPYSSPYSGGAPSATPSGGDYVPYQCNKNIAPGTTVSPNQLPPCQTFVSAGGNNWTAPPLVPGNFTEFESLNDVISHPMFEPLWNMLNAGEKAFLTANWQLAPMALINFAITKEAGETFYEDPDQDNGNANAFRHALWTGLNAIAWDSEALAKNFAHLHENNPGSTEKQKTMDRTNNEAGVVFARTWKNPVDLINAILNDMGTLYPKTRRILNNAADGLLIYTNTGGRR